MTTPMASGSDVQPAPGVDPGGLASGVDWGGPATGSDVRERLTPPRHPLAMFVWPTAWGAVLYCATSIVIGLGALVAGVLGVLFLPWVGWATANLERGRLGLLGLPKLTPYPRFRGRYPWDPQGFGEGNIAVWGITVLFGVALLVPAAIICLPLIAFALVLVQAMAEHPWTIDVLLATVGLFIVMQVGLYVAWGLASVQAILVDLQLRPHSELAQRVDELTSSRRELVDVFAAERRRIERDLHDGAQQHLVLLSMHLGEADYALSHNQPDAARHALGAAQLSVEATLTALRETVRGIHPQILSDLGLVAAVRELAARQPLAVHVEVSGDVRPSEQVALGVYYLVSEAFTNVVKHAGATAATVRLTLGDPLEVEVYDDGRGGAHVLPGHGLSGLVERARVLGGDVWITSPPGGPTLLRASFPNPTGVRGAERPVA